jgi:hypothetical protein
MTVVAVLNRTPGLEDKTVAFYAEAWNLQAREIADVHGFTYTPVVFFSSAEGLPVDCRVLTIRPTIDFPGALGYHDDAGGAIFAEVKFTGDAGVTGSHEIAEEMGDPTCDTWVPFDADHEQAAELCDRVEGDSYVQPATVLGETAQIRVSNYLLPSAFDPSKGGPFDRLGLLKDRTAMTAGGYIILRDITTGKVGDVFARGAGARIVSGPKAGMVLAEKLARRGGRLLRRLRG